MENNKSLEESQTKMDIQGPHQDASYSTKAGPSELERTPQGSIAAPYNGFDTLTVENGDKEEVTYMVLKAGADERTASSLKLGTSGDLSASSRSCVVDETHKRKFRSFQTLGVIRIV